MTEKSIGACGAAALQGHTGPWRVELREMLRLAAPIVFTQLAWVAMLSTDTAMMGHLGPVPLAGAALAGMVFFLGHVFCFGIVTATAGLAAQAYGARKPRLVRRVIRQGLWVTIAISVPAVLAFGFLPEILTLLDQPAEAIPAADAYMTVLKWSLPFGVGFAVLRNFVSALNRPAVALWVMLCAVPLNALLDYALIFGNFGAPRLEMFGAGLATAIVNAVMFAALLVIALTGRRFARYSILGRFWRPDWHQFGQIFAIGLPIAGTLILEAGFFIAAGFVMGKFGSASLAAHMIAMQLPHITFMVPMGMAQAATVRVGHAVGRRNPAAVHRAGWVAMGLTLAFMSAATVIILSIPEYFAAIFLDGARADSAAVLALATTFLLYAAFFQVVDGMQAVAAGALRGLNDTAVPMVLAAVSYWIVGAAAGLWLAFGVGMDGRGLWLGFLFGLSSAALMLTWRFYRLARAGYLPAMRANI